MHRAELGVASDVGRLKREFAKSQMTQTFPRLTRLPSTVLLRFIEKLFYGSDTHRLRNLERRTLHALWRTAGRRALPQGDPTRISARHPLVHDRGRLWQRRSRRHARARSRWIAARLLLPRRGHWSRLLQRRTPGREGLSALYWNEQAG